MDKKWIPIPVGKKVIGVNPSYDTINLFDARPYIGYTIVEDTIGGDSGHAFRLEKDGETTGYFYNADLEKIFLYERPRPLIIIGKKR